MIERWIPRTVAGRVLLAAAVALIAFVVALAVLLPIVLQGYGSTPDVSLAGVGARLVSAIALAAIAAALVAFGVSRVVGGSIAQPLDELAMRMRAETARGWSGDEGPLEVTGLANVLQRIAATTAERQATAERERDRLATLLREMADAVLIVDQDDVITQANPAADRLLATTAVRGRPLVAVVRDHEILEAVAEARREGAATAEIERMDPRRAVRLIARRLPGGDVLLTAQDLTTLRRLETVRRDFVANVSHELRTPIASLKAMAEALEGGAIDDPTAARDFVSRMHREIDELAQLVTELMALTRVESGADRIDRRPVLPREILASASRLAPLAERAGIHLEIAVPDDVPAVSADPERIAQVVSNLVHNAVKFTPPGGHVFVWAESGEGNVRILVRDTGVGIDAGELDRIFERFYKGERSRASAGTGLGLAVARHIVQAHGGTIEVESEGPGRGSTFSFTLPLAEAATPAPA